MKGLDLGNFKKVSETHTHAVLEHPDGHQIHIAKSALKPKTAAMLAKLPTKMAAGGRADEESVMRAVDPPFRLEDPEDRAARSFIEPMAKQYSKDRMPADATKMAAGGMATAQNQAGNLKEKYAKGGNVRNMAVGGISTSADINSPQGGYLPSSYDQMQAQAAQMGNTAGGLRPAPLPQGPGGSPALSDASLAASGNGAVQPTNPIIDIPGIARASQSPGMNQPALASAMDQYVKGYQNAFGQQEAGIRAQSAAEGHLGEREADAMAADQSMKLLVKQNYEDQYNQLNDHIVGAIKDIDDGHIDPMHYMNSKTDWGRARTAIGVILGGMGSGLTGGPNQALQFINNQIDRDVMAQRLNLGKKQTVLQGYQQLTGNLKDATAMTWGFYNDLYTNELRKQAALARDPLAKAQAQQLIGEREQQKAQVLGPLAFQRALLSTMGSGNADPATAVRLYGQMGIINPKQSEDAMKEVGMMQNHEAQSRTILQAFDQANSDNTIGNRVMHGGYEPASVDALKTAMMPYLKDAEGRINDSELERTDGLIPRPGDGAQKIAQKRQALANFLEEKAATPTLNSLGIRARPTGAALSRPNANVIPGYNGGR